MSDKNYKPKLEILSYYKQSLSNINHTRQILLDCGLLDNDLRLQFLTLEKNLSGKIKNLEYDIQNGIIL